MTTASARVVANWGHAREPLFDLGGGAVDGDQRVRQCLRDAGLNLRVLRQGASLDVALRVGERPVAQWPMSPTGSNSVPTMNRISEVVVRARDWAIPASKQNGRTIRGTWVPTDRAYRARAPSTSCRGL